MCVIDVVNLRNEAFRTHDHDTVGCATTKYYVYKIVDLVRVAIKRVNVFTFCLSTYCGEYLESIPNQLSQFIKLVFGFLMCIIDSYGFVPVNTSRIELLDL